MANKKQKPKKESFTERNLRRGREAVDLTQTLVNEPKSFPKKAGGLIRRSVRVIWQTRGGGMYATGFLLTFLWLEARMVVADIIEAESIADFFGDQLFEIFFRYLGESFQNTIQAFIWPVHVITSSEYGWVLLIAIFWFYTFVLDARVERWLGVEPEPEESGPEKDA